MIDHYRRFNGMPLEDPSEALPVMFELENADTPVGDFPGLTSHIPVFSRRGAEVLGAWVSAAGDLVPLRCRDGDDAYVGLNVTHRMDALDGEHSRVKRFRSGRIMQILRHVFVAERLMERRWCPSCGVRIRQASDPCPYCKQGERRPGCRTGVVIV